jgi:hypothetical protein
MAPAIKTIKTATKRTRIRFFITKNGSQGETICQYGELRRVKSNHGGRRPVGFYKNHIRIGREEQEEAPKHD